MRFSHAKAGLGIAALAALLAFGSTANAAPVSKCNAAKKKCIGKYIAAQMGCHAKAESKGLAVDPACLAKGTAKITTVENKGCFDKNDLKIGNDCSNTSGAGPPRSCRPPTRSSPTSSTTSTRPIPRPRRSANVALPRRNAWARRQRVCWAARPRKTRPASSRRMFGLPRQDHRQVRRCEGLLHQRPAQGRGLFGGPAEPHHRLDRNQSRYLEGRRCSQTRRCRCATAATA